MPRSAGPPKPALLKMMSKVPSEDEAAMVLAARARSYLNAEELLSADAEDRIDVWTWDGAKKQPVARSYLPDDASRLYAAPAGTGCPTKIDPDNEQIRLLYLTALLENAAHENGLDNPLPASAGSPAALAAAFRRRRRRASVGRVDARRLHGGPPRLRRESSETPARPRRCSTIGRNRARWSKPLENADRRLRFAAVEAIMRLEPVDRFAGSSYVVEALAFLAGTRGHRRAIVAGPVTEESLRIAGYLAAMGYEVDTASNGKGLMRLAIASPDYELGLVAASLDGPPSAVLIQHLRHDGRTAGMPIGVLARADLRNRADRTVRDDPLAEAFARPHTEVDVTAIVEQVAALAGRKAVPHDQRQVQAAQALGWIAVLTGLDQKVFDLGRVEDAALAAQYVPMLGSTAVEVLGNLGTPKSQQALVDLASRWTQPLELRRAAARALGGSIRDHGILLTASQILMQYDRYNQSADRDAGTQQVLASILDAIEAPEPDRSGAQEPTADGRRAAGGGRRAEA